MGGKIKWIGKGIKEHAVNEKGEKIIICDKKYFRPTEVETLLGKSSKARKVLKWKNTISINELISEMVNFENKDIAKKNR